MTLPTPVPFEYRLIHEDGLVGRSWLVLCRIQGHGDEVSYGPTPHRIRASTWMDRHRNDSIPKRSTMRMRPCLGCNEWMDPSYMLFCVECWPGGAKRGLGPIPQHDPTCTHPADRRERLGRTMDDLADIWRCRCGFMWTGQEPPQ